MKKEYDALRLSLIVSVRDGKSSNVINDISNVCLGRVVDFFVKFQENSMDFLCGFFADDSNGVIAELE